MKKVGIKGPCFWCCLCRSRTILAWPHFAFPVAASVAIRKCITNISSQVVKLREEKRVSEVSHLPPGRRCYEFSHLLLRYLSSPQPRITISSSRVSTLFALLPTTYYILISMYFNTAVTCTSTNSLPKYSRRSFSLPLSVSPFFPSSSSSSFYHEVMRDCRRQGKRAA